VDLNKSFFVREEDLLGTAGGDMTQQRPGTLQPFRSGRVTYNLSTVFHSKLKRYCTCFPNHFRLKVSLVFVPTRLISQFLDTALKIIF